ncbi:hypothetical protein BB934_45225 (plasmid) [Microvirga ossetica]|uniref:Uncharacterized protein n=1 Tax=Microvirga ossetica TaxID=1882682 RepID=A0A1B2EZQ0_9HYPH|nr:hypothetical protein [Microvirga ossetica]ANY85424.1 hypothetical protein BB934_45225 [Microvirga ossetica]
MNSNKPDLLQLAIAFMTCEAVALMVSLALNAGDHPSLMTSQAFGVLMMIALGGSAALLRIVRQ